MNIQKNHSRRILAIILVLAVATLACSINFNLPIRDVKTGPAQTMDINVPNPTSVSQATEVFLGFGAGTLNLSPGATNALVSGTATYNVEDLKPEIRTEGSQVHIDTGNFNINGIPNFGEKLKNDWSLKLGDAPMKLNINAGAYEGNLELGGISLQALDITDGASKVNLSFSQPNKTEMNTLQYKTGASNINLTGLANANFDTLNFKGGAGEYTLDFTGELKRNATVTVDAGVSSVHLIVPEGTAARVLFDGGLTNVDISGSWQKSGNQYTQTGSGPQLTINVNMGAGSLNLKNK